MFLGNPSAQSYITCPHCTDPTSQLQSCACIIGMAFSLATVTGSDTSIWPKCTESKSNLEPLWEREAFHWKQSRTETRCCCHRPQIESTLCSCCLVTKLCPTIYDPMDWSPPGSSVHEILQARILEWVAISYSRGSCWPRDGTLVSRLLHWQAGSLLLVSPGKPSGGPTFATFYCSVVAVMETFLMGPFHPSAFEAVEIQRG